jgi:type II secretory pathway component GspD/PulD (secretin)
VVTDVRSSQLVVVATEKEMPSVEELATKLDVPTKQVLIEARIVETSLNPKTSKGIDWSGTLGNQKFSFGNNVNNAGRYSTDVAFTTNSAFGGWITKTTYSDNQLLSNPRLMWDTVKGLNPSTAFLDADGLSAVLSFLNTDSDAKVLATPRAVTLDNETANLSVTEARPIFKTTAGTQGSPGGSEITYTNLGTILQVTPRISANNFINLKVIPEVSTFVNTVSKTVSGQISEADVFAFRRIDTQVLIPSGNTLVLGGLVSDSSTKAYTKVPIVGDIPIVGLAFRKESKERNQKNLIIFITPTIVQDSDFQPTQTDFLKTKPRDPSQKPWSAWDSGKPAIDWTKLSGDTKEQ